MKGPLSAIAKRIREEQQVQARAVLALVQLGAGGAADPREVARRLRAEIGDPAQVLVVGVEAADRQRLRALNNDREGLFRSLRALVFICTSGEAARALRREAPDLTSVFDLSAELEEAVELTREELDKRLREVQHCRYASLELSGLVPHAADVVQVPMEAVFLARKVNLPRADMGEAPGLTLLLAEPGAGKTVWMKQFAANEPQRLVLYAALAGWVAQAREQSVSLLDFLQAQVGRLLGLPPVVLGPHLAAMGLFLDGLDEVPNQGDRRRIVDEALVLRSQFPGLGVVVSAREHVIDDLLSEQIRKLRVARFIPLSRQQGEELVGRLLRARRGLSPGAELSAELSTLRQRTLRQSIVRHPDFGRFFGNPLLLTFVTVLAELGRGMPAQRAELYGELVEMLIVSWQRVRASSTGQRLNKADVLRVVAPLGWRLVERGVGGLTEGELLDFLVELDTREDNPESARAAARHRLDQLREDSALLHATDGLWRFHHATIAEYLAARAALLSPEVLAVLLDDPYEPRRVQVLAFTLAIACDLDPRDDVALPLLKSLDAKARRRGRYDARIPRTLVACLEEARSMPTALRQRLAAHVLRVALRQHLNPDRRLEAFGAVQSLCALHDAPVQAAIREAVEDERAIDASGLAAAVLAPSVWLLDLAPLPVLLSQGGVDTTPLIYRWISSDSPAVRALAWDAWVVDDAWTTVVKGLDPTAYELAVRVEHTGPRPPSWTAAIRARFPELPAGP